MLDKQLKKLERKFGKFAVNKLMLYIVAGMFMLFVGEMVAESMPNVQGSIYSFLNFDRELILRGQVWRLISFIFLPPIDVRPRFMIFELYFCWLFGNSLEEHWGSFRFNVYYLLGTLGAIISGFITGGASNHFLNMSLLIAFAMIYPDHEILLFFFLPIKMKWIAAADAVFMIWTLIMGAPGTKLLIVFSFVNLLLFFGGDMYVNVRYFFRKKFGKGGSGRGRKKEKRAKNIDISKRR